MVFSQKTSMNPRYKHNFIYDHNLLSYRIIYHRYQLDTPLIWQKQSKATNLQHKIKKASIFWEKITD